jgi:hypothetical protein
MTLDARDQSIITQVAAKIASDLAIASTDTEIDVILQDFATAFPTVREAIVDAVNTAIAEAVLPGSTPVAGPGPAPAAAPAAGPGPAAAPAPAAGPGPVGPGPAGPAAIPGATTGGNEAHWQDLFENFGNWYDNRATKDSPNKPDFRHKTKMDAAGKYKLGLYVNGKDTPQWVKERLGAA